jgi:UDP-N-acetylglucosamine:LPS N-acetylglucosamine transferase
MNQLVRLLDNSASWPQQPDFYVTTLSTVAKKLEKRGPVFVIGEANRQHPFKAALVLWRSMRVAVRERPDLVITTGSMPLAFFCFIAKRLGASIVWIDSIANIERLSVSGRFAAMFADLVLTQWPDLATPDGRVQYAGEIL